MAAPVRITTKIPPKKHRGSQQKNVLMFFEKSLILKTLWISSRCKKLLIQTPKGSPFFTSSLDPQKSSAPRRKAARHASVAASPGVYRRMCDDDIR